MPDTSPLVIGSKAGIKRDGTQLEGDYYVDGKWVRFQRGLPRKMRGYRRLLGILSGPPRELEIFTADNLSYCHSGHGAGLERFLLNEDHQPVSVITDRTPAGFTVDPNNDWQFAEVYDTASAKLKLLGVAVPTLMSPDSSVTRPIYIGDAYGTAALAPIAGSPGKDVSGGIMSLQTYAVAYGSDGAVLWSVPNAPGDFTTTASGAGGSNVTDQKIIYGLPIRGGGQSPAALLWSLNALLRMSFVGGGPIFNFDTLSDQSSILSANSVVEYDGIYYWMGVDRFLMYNGVLQELDNDLNLNFTFDNINFDVRGKAFAFKIPRWGEIWWCLPMFGSTEPNHAVIYNVRESRRLGYPVWYDTPLPEEGRGAAHYPTAHPHPLLTGALKNGVGNNTYSLWHHEDGVDQVIGTSTLAIQSYFETADTSLLLQQQPMDAAMRVEMMEPDFVQAGEMRYQVSGRMNARAPQVYTDPVKTFPDTATGPETEVVQVKEQRRELRHRFESNVVGGDYEMGQPIVHVAPADKRRTS